MNEPVTISSPDESSPGFTRRVLLGLFIVGQIWFLSTTCLVRLVQDYNSNVPDEIKPALKRLAPDWTERTGHTHELFEILLRTNGVWEQLSAQYQGWSLFPYIGRECVFPAMLLHWDEEPWSAPALGRTLRLWMDQQPLNIAALAWEGKIADVSYLSPAARRAATHLPSLAATHGLEGACYQMASSLDKGQKPFPPPARLILSDNEPKDIHEYIRFGQFRLRRLEGNCVIYLYPYEDETDEKRLARYGQSIAKFVRNYQDLIFDYMRWRWRQIETNEPTLKDNPPRQIIYVMRRYHVRGPNEGPEFWNGPFDMPVARFQPDVSWDQDHPYRLEYYNPETERFQSLAK